MLEDVTGIVHTTVQVPHEPMLLFEFIRVCPCSCHWAGQEVKKELGFPGRMKSEHLVKKEKTNPSELMVRALWCYVAASNESMSV